MAIRWGDLDVGWAAMAAAARPALSGLIAQARPTWHAAAACHDRPDLDWFSPTDVDATREVCGTCPVNEACGQAGAQEALGVWGGQARGFPAVPGGRPAGCVGCGRDGVMAREMCPACYRRDRRARGHT